MFIASVKIVYRIIQIKTMVKNLISIPLIISLAAPWLLLLASHIISRINSFCSACPLHYLRIDLK